ncbi:hypothetical protein A2686_03240 [Candidatus Woesebacteria bacterium RIFCSPHIGHO2_01_FULL_38_10]|uniref:Polysaccharide biosynthesis protein C-terminal domain-containing protein n=1 Tax=Candidatus Woesebacteria bacterium RIFCSPLOWO2_01_FULL_39_10b TaxID=1802517 RepID=A0A1F8B5H0_9BACT|nr:MAG: hypothetical protein A2686_03240 [Candidatus Woesebacteria bacterium RIFCSPHIGHO2_01_FULL_38_10]OGM59276.1 MAG: hypothetical protein A2892_05435 [Candidatus Woesebacteria bacterium RIFCSPLOWO2_01_FULL_39_10b]
MIKKAFTRIPAYSFASGVFATATFRQSVITSVGTLINGGLGAIFYIVTARYLGPSDFGLMIVAITTLTLVGDIGDLGTNTGIVKFVGKYASQNLEKAERFLKLGLKVKLGVICLVLIFGFLGSSDLADLLFSEEGLAAPLKIAFVGVGSYLLFSFVISSLQAFQKFIQWSLIQIGTNFLRLFIVFLFISLGILGLKNALLVYTLVPFMGFLVGLNLLSVKFWKVKNEGSIVKDFFAYNKWVALFSIASAIGARLDTFISARLLSATDVGIYSAAVQLVQIVPQCVAAISTVVAPRMAGLSTIGELVKYMKKVQIMVLGIAILALFFVPFATQLLPLIYGKAYLGSTTPFLILFFGMLVLLISVPVHMAIIYYFSYPKFFFYLSITNMILVGFLGWNLISVNGTTGAAITVLLGQIFNFIVPLIWVLRKICTKTKSN